MKIETQGAGKIRYFPQNHFYLIIWSSTRSLPAKYQMSIQTASVHAPILGVQHPAPQARREVG